MSTTQVNTDQIHDGAITNAKVASDAAIAWSKIDKTGASGSDFGSVTLQGTSPGTAQSGHLNITGYGLFGAIKSGGAVSGAGYGAFDNLSIGSGNFSIDANGNIIVLNGQTTTFPVANAQGYLFNDGSGTFTYEYLVKIQDSSGFNGDLPVLWSSGYSGYHPVMATNSKLKYNPNTGVLTSTGGFSGDLVGNADTATNSDNSKITDNVSVSDPVYPVWATDTSGYRPASVSSTKLTFVPSTGQLLATGGFSGDLVGNADTATDADNADNADYTKVIEDVSTSGVVYPTWVTGTSGYRSVTVTSTGVSFVPNVGKLAVTRMYANYYAAYVGAAVDSAPTISPTGGIFHVTGTSGIDTINLPYTGYTGTITLIPDAAFTTTTSGNIAIASTAVSGKTLDMTFDGTKWYPSYT